MKHTISVDGFSYRLRPVKLSDASFIIEVRLEDLERNKYIHRISEDVGEQEEWIKRYFTREDDYYFVVENRLTGEPEGLIGIYDIKDGKAEWGRWVIRKNSLAASESVKLLYEVAFEKLGLNELYCRTLEVNTGVVSFHNSVGEKTRRIIKDCFELDGEKFNAVEQYADRDIFYNEMQPQLERQCAVLFKRNMRLAVGSFEFHHIGVACKSINKDFVAFSLMGYTKESAIFEDTNQGIRGVFITAANQPRLELLENLEGSETLSPMIASQNKMYHFAYYVSDIEKAVKVLSNAKAKVISPLKQSTYFGKRICFLLLSNMYMVELMEK